jgi:hypothetical protein
MKLWFVLATIAVCFLVTAPCGIPKEAHAVATPFIQGNVRIVPPVKIKMEKKGFREELHTDGGTKMVTIIDARGKSLDLYMYHRSGSEKNWGYYLNGYPEYKGGIHVTNEADFERKILYGVLKWNKKNGEVSFQ